MPNNNLDIFLRIVLDEAAKQRAVQGIQQVNNAAVQGTEEARRSQLKESTILLDDALNLSGQRVKLSDKEADAIIANTNRVAQVQRLQSRETLKLADAINIASQAALVAGGAITGGLFGLAAKYVKDATEATQQTYEWAAAWRVVNQSGDRVGQVVVNEVLPGLRKAAEFADRASRFVQQHPDIVKAALNIGGALVAIGTVGTLVSKGVRMYADLQFYTSANNQLSAARLMLEASMNQLEAAGIQREFSALGGGLGKGLGGAGALGGALAAAGEAVAAVAIVGIGLDVAQQIGNALAGAIYGKNYKQQNLGDAALTFTRLFTGHIINETRGNIARGTGDIAAENRTIESLQGFDKWFGTLVHANAYAEQAASSVDALNVSLGKLAGSPHEQEIVAAYEDMLKKIDDSEQQYGSQRLRIIQQEGKDEARAAEELQKRVAEIDTEYTQRLSSLREDAAKADLQAEQQYAEDVAKAKRDARIEEQRAEQDHERKLAQLKRDHQDALYDIESNRDALGLVREQHAYQEKIDDENQQYADEKARRKQDLKLRLQDMQRQYEEEKQQRAEQLAENLAQAAAQHQQELAQAQAAYKDQIKQMQDNEKDRLDELAREHRDEIARLKEGFYDQVKALDDSLLSPEIKLKQQAYSIMLQDAQNFINQYGQILTGVSPQVGAGGGGSGTTKHDYSGYVYTGLYRMAQDGLPEYVIGGKATKAAEKLVGGKLTEDMIMAALVGLNPKAVNYQDHRRFATTISAEDRRRIERDTRRMLEGLFA